MNEKMIRIGDVKRMSGLSKTTIYRLAGKGLFPKPRRLSHRISVWTREEIETWLNMTVQDAPCDQ